MKKKNQSFITYKREKGKVEISGDANDTKGLMWADMISSKLWIVLVIVLLLTIPKASILPVVLQWLKNQNIFMTFFVAAAVLLLSG